MRAAMSGRSAVDISMPAVEMPAVEMPAVEKPGGIEIVDIFLSFACHVIGRGT